MTAAERRDLSELAADLGAEARFGQPLAELTTWRIGGPAEALVCPHTRAALQAVTAWTRAAGCPLRVLGNGSNLLAPDEGVAGVVLHLANHLAGHDFDRDELWAEAGCFLPKLARQAAELGRTGLECLVGVPGTIGGACVTNAGIPSGTIGDALLEVEALGPDGNVVTLPKAALALGHRDSRLRHEPWTVLAARLALGRDEPAAILARLAAHLAYRRATQPLNQPSCGSVFRRPAQGFPGAILEAAGCKGLTRGAAQVSELHANWIVNLGGATAADVRALMAEMQARARAGAGVELTPEVVIWSAD